MVRKTAPDRALGAIDEVRVVIQAPTSATAALVGGPDRTERMSESKPKPGEKPTSERAQDAIDEYYSVLWEQYQKLTKIVKQIEGNMQEIDRLRQTVSPRSARRIIDHIVAYLESCGHAAQEDNIVEAMVRAGAAAGRRDSVKQIRDSISANLAPRNKKPKLRRGHAHDEMVGLAEWDEEKFS